jgi:hypothetical protein
MTESSHNGNDLPTAPGAVPARTAGRTPSSYWLTRFVLLRLLGFVYLIAFLVAANQIVPLVGEHGLLPARAYLDLVGDHFGSRANGFLQLPSLFWIQISDSFLTATAWVGVLLSAAVLCGYANALVMLLLWALYLSFVHIGQDWYGFGWETQLLETGFLAIFLCPLLDGRPFPRRPSPRVVLWLFRWLIFRIMLGAGLIKLRGDPCWRDLTCMYYHYETQPIPNPISWWLYFRPHAFHKFETLWNHIIELVVPWFAFYPRLSRHVAGVLLVSFQILLIVSGNLSFLNWLTIVPALACFDDTFWRKILPQWLVGRAQAAENGAVPSLVQERVSYVLAAVVAVLSIAPVANLLSSQQMMNTSFTRLHLVNTYGAFGSVGRERPEIVFEGTDDFVPTEHTVWKEYQFKAKPSDPMRRPPFIAPYQPRLDWQIWFAAMSDPAHYPWTLHFVWKLLDNDPGTLSLLDGNPFPKQPPHFIRARWYRYRFAPPGDRSGAWWIRSLDGEWLPPLSRENAQLRQILKAYGWLPSARENKP